MYVIAPKKLRFYEFMYLYNHKMINTMYIHIIHTTAALNNMTKTHIIIHFNYLQSGGTSFMLVLRSNCIVNINFRYYNIHFYCFETYLKLLDRLDRDHEYYLFSSFRLS